MLPVVDTQQQQPLPGIKSPTTGDKQEGEFAIIWKVNLWQEKSLAMFADPAHSEPWNCLRQSKLPDLTGGRDFADRSLLQGTPHNKRPWRVPEKQRRRESQEPGYLPARPSSQARPFAGEARQKGSQHPPFPQSHCQALLTRHSPNGKPDL